MAVHIGTWSNGTPIDIAGVPLDYATHEMHGVFVCRMFEASNGGTFEAYYVGAECRPSACLHVHQLARVIEWMPPPPPQIQRLDESCRLEMPTVAEEIEQRRKEWAEHLATRV